MVVMAVSLLDKGRWLRRPSGRTTLRRVCGDRLLLGHVRSAGARLNNDRGPGRQLTAKAPRPVKTRVRPDCGHRTDHRSEGSAGSTHSDATLRVATHRRSSMAVADGGDPVLCVA